jgi:DNA polymerase-3 subunit epsilon
MERINMKLSHELVVLDLETTGVWIDHDKIIEIALIKRTPANDQETYLRRVNPQMAIPQEVTELTGISDEDVQNEPVFGDLARDVLDFIGDADLAGFNIEKFDLPLLERELQEAGFAFNWRTRTIFDAQKIFHINEKRDLTAAYRFYCHKELQNAHSALKDTEATLEILENQIERYGEGDPHVDVLKQFQYRKKNHFFDDERKFRWWNGKLYMMFGKYARKYTLQEVVKMDRKYLEWVLSANFSQEVKDLVNDALIGKFPVSPEKMTTDEKGQGKFF